MAKRRGSLEVERVIADDMKSLGELLSRPLTAARLGEWKRSVGSLLPLKGTIFGAIRWSTSMAPLLTARHEDAFEIRLTHTESYIDYRGGPHWVTIVAPDRPPSKWSGPDDADYFRVSFLASGLVPERVYSLDVAFTTEAHWQEVNPLMHRVHAIEPPGRQFTAGEITFLEPFEVTHRIVTTATGRHG
jgi:hypothetical protein